MAPKRGVVYAGGPAGHGTRLSDSQVRDALVLHVDSGLRVVELDEDRSFTALLFMKGHSERVPGKNLRQLCGRPLYHWIVESLLAVPQVGRLVVETDSALIADDLRSEFGIEALDRPASLLGDDVVMNPLISGLLPRVAGESFIQTHATNPLLSPATITKAIAVFQATRDHDSLFSVTEVRARFYSSLGQAINHDPLNLVPTQELVPVLEENSCLYVFTRSSFEASGHRIGQDPILFRTPPLESVDIDEEHEFLYAEHLMRLRLEAL